MDMVKEWNKIFLATDAKKHAGVPVIHDKIDFKLKAFEDIKRVTSF